VRVLLTTLSHSRRLPARSVFLLSSPGQHRVCKRPVAAGCPSCCQGDRAETHECLERRCHQERHCRDRAKTPSGSRIPHRGVCGVFGAVGLDNGLDVFVVADAGGGLTLASHEPALSRLEHAGARLCSWMQVLLEFQRDWTRHATYEAARAIVVANGGGYRMGLANAREMTHPT
jgi:hypothetical protein